MTLAPEPHPDGIEYDRRRYRRFAISLPGRFMRANKEEATCRLQNISVGSATLITPVSVEADERIIGYFEHLGGLEGRVVRRTPDGFTIQLTATQHKREKLAAQITWLINRHELASAEDRKHERRAVARKHTVLKLGGGISIEACILDVSESGASLQTTARPPIGTDVQLGALSARVARYHDQGIGIQFYDLQDAEALRNYLE